MQLQTNKWTVAVNTNGKGYKVTFIELEGRQMVGQVAREDGEWIPMFGGEWTTAVTAALQTARPTFPKADDSYVGADGEGW